MCELCTKGTVGDDFHCLLECDLSVENIRKLLDGNLTYISANVFIVKNGRSMNLILCLYTKVCNFVEDKLLTNLDQDNILCSPPHILSF